MEFLNLWRKVLQGYRHLCPLYTFVFQKLWYDRILLSTVFTWNANKEKCLSHSAMCIINRCFFIVNMGNISIVQRRQKSQNNIKPVGGLADSWSEDIFLDQPLSLHILPICSVSSEGQQVLNRNLMLPKFTMVMENKWNNAFHYMRYKGIPSLSQLWICLWQNFLLSININWLRNMLFTKSGRFFLYKDRR